MSIYLIIVIGFAAGVLLGYLLSSKKKKNVDGVLYCGVTKEGKTWMGLSAYDPLSLFTKDTAVFRVQLRDQYNSNNEIKEEKSHE